MRIGVIGPDEPDTFADNVADCLPDLGVQVVRLGPVRRQLPGKLDVAADLVCRAWPTIDERLQRRVVNAAVAAECDAVISVSALLLPASIDALHRARIRSALWFPDHVSNLDRQLMLAGDYDRLYFKEPLLVSRLSSLTKLPVSYLPEACNPRWHRPVDTLPASGSIVVAGNMYPSRVRLLDRLVGDGIPLQIYGNRFPVWLPNAGSAAAHTGRYIVREQKAATFRAAGGVLNNLHPSEVSGVNCRLFEAAACGAAVLCEDREALHELFEVGTEVLSFRDYEELTGLCRRLLDEPEWGRQVGDAATRRAHAEHTYQHRLALILDDLVG